MRFNVQVTSERFDADFPGFLLCGERRLFACAVLALGRLGATPGRVSDWDPGRVGCRVWHDCDGCVSGPQTRATDS